MLSIVLYKNTEITKEEYEQEYIFANSYIDDPRIKLIKTENESLERTEFSSIKDNCDTKYIIFLSTLYLRGFLEQSKKVLKVLEEGPEYNIAELKIFRIDRNGNRKYFENYSRTNLKANDNRVNINISAFIFNTEFSRGINVFNVQTDFDALFIASAIEKAKTYSLINIEVETTDFPDTDFYNYRRQYHKDWYNNELNDYLNILPELNKKSILMKYISYMIQQRFAFNRNNRNKSLLEEGDYTNFKRLVTRILKYIPDNFICRYNLAEKKILPKYMLVRLLLMKHGTTDLTVLSGTNDAYFGLGDRIIERSSNFSLDIKAINNDKDNLIIDVELVNAYCLDEEKIKITLHTNGFKSLAQRTYVYTQDKYFGEVYKEGKSYQFKIPKQKIKDFIFFRLKYLSSTIKLPLNFVKTASRLTNQFDRSYYIKFNTIFTYDAESFEIKATPFKLNKAIGLELGLYADFLKEIFNKENKRSAIAKTYSAVKAISLRLTYWLLKPLYRNKPIWITFDQLFKGGDNGEYFFKFLCNNKNNEVDPYYIINKDCGDSIRLKEHYSSNLLAFNTNKCRLISLMSDVVLATRVDVKQYLGFTNIEEHYYRNLLNYKVICLQHGLSIQEIAEYQNRLFDNTKLYCCASHYEIDNLLQPSYDYKKRQLLLTGLPRYDGLISKAKRLILIAPTWRRNVTAGTNAKGKQHNYSESFKYSEYFRLYNSLINNKRLIDAAKRMNYKIIYLIHPILSPQIGDFRKNQYVSIIGGAGNEISYEKMLTEAALMVTDHSGIQYDFAYMKKPILYYHPDSLPPQYMAKTMNYENMGFGPVCKNEANLVEYLIKYMQRNCKMEEVYKSRVKDFFNFEDHNNCQRIYDTLKSNGV